MEKNAKKTNKKPFLVAGFALLLALIGCVGGVTYSKYISNTDVPSTQATVAKWGYVLTADSTSLWGTKYSADTTTNTAKVDKDNGTVIVSATADSVLAPGATGSVVVTVNGTAEVKSKLTFVLGNENADSISDISLTDKASPANVYNPVKWTATLTGTSTKDGTPTTISKEIAEDTTLAAVKAALADTANIMSIDANTTLTDVKLTLKYAWAFDGVADSGLDNNGTAVTGDEADTILGKFADGNGTISATDQYSYASTWTPVTTVKLSLTASLAQVQ